MNSLKILLIATIVIFTLSLTSQAKSPFIEKSRLIILADMGNEPDEEQQMAHMLVCNNEFDLEGLIAVTGKYLRTNPRDDLFHKLINGYEKVYKNLQKHADGWHDPDFLHSITKAGQGAYGIQDVKEGNASPGSELIVAALEKDDPRPIWIVINAGSNTLAQALVDYQEAHSAKELASAVAKICVFENGAQDNAGAWICAHFPKIHWIRSNYQTYAYGGPGGTDGNTRVNLGPYFWQPYEYSVEGQNEWLKEHVMKNHGALGEIFPERRFKNGNLAFMEGGGTVPWLGLVNKGLFDINHPNWGGWSGRFTENKVADFWSRHGDIRVDEVEWAPFYVHREVSDTWTDVENNQTISGDYVPVWRWRRAMYNDFLCRMDWCVAKVEDANHHPKAVFDGDASDSIIRLTADPGETINLNATGSSDPDDDELTYSWWMYQEAGTYAGALWIENADSINASVTIPTGAANRQIHVILEVKDVNEIASLYDYRRIVIDVTGNYDHSSLTKQKH